MEDAFELLGYIRDNDFEGMLKFCPYGVEHRGSEYLSPWHFELAHHYEEDARYQYPARELMKQKCLDLVKEILERSLSR